MSDTDRAIIESSTDQIWPREPASTRPVVEYPLPDARPARCKSCGAAIVWAISPRGAHLPLSRATRSAVASAPVKAAGGSARTAPRTRR